VSGIAAAFNLDGRPAEPELIRAMLDAIAYRGPDGLNCWSRGAVALGHAMLRTTPESATETQPLVDERAGLVLVMDGRIDNREELEKELDARGFPPRAETDAEIALRAYECWGEEAPARILGDFALVIWDDRSQRLFCARDFAGIRPFYYCLNGRTLLCASELHQILEDPRVPREPDEDVIAPYLAEAEIVDNETTLYRRICRLAPAHSLIVTRDGITKRRYYDLDPSKRVRYKTDDQYAEHFLEIFSQAVRARMRSISGVASQLSGGLDSSFIVCVAQHLVRTGVVSSPLEAFSLVFSDPDCDERRFIDDVVAKSGVKCHAIDPFAPDLEFWRNGARHYRDFIGHPNGVMSCSLIQAAHESGFRVVLTGHGGDEFLTGSPQYYADLLTHLRFIELMRALTEEKRTMPRGWGISELGYLGIFLRGALWPMVPKRWKGVIRTLRRGSQIPAHVSKGLAERTGLKRRLASELPYPKRTKFAQRHRYRALYGAFDVHCMELIGRQLARFGAEGRHPFFDRRVVEFAFAIPEEQRCKEGWNKYIMRRAGRGLLPDSVRERRDKAEFSSVFDSSFEALRANDTFSAPALVDRGWVEEANFREICRTPKRYRWPIWAVLETEFWYEENLKERARKAPISDQETFTFQSRAMIASKSS
jgi:asparagine synthase (glutamine-hydrolysing)